jgi:hypothetical protein
MRPMALENVGEQLLAQFQSELTINFLAQSTVCDSLR